MASGAGVDNDWDATHCSQPEADHYDFSNHHQSSLMQLSKGGGPCKD